MKKFVIATFLASVVLFTPNTALADGYESEYFELAQDKKHFSSKENEKDDKKFEKEKDDDKKVVPIPSPLILLLTVLPFLRLKNVDKP